MSQVMNEDLFVLALCRPGSDLLSRVLRHSTIGAEAFNFRVRDGIGSGHLAIATRPAKRKSEETHKTHQAGVPALTGTFSSGPDGH